MRIREGLLAGAAVTAGLGLLGHSGGHPGAHPGIVVVPGPPPVPAPLVASTSAPSPAQTAVGDIEAKPAPEAVELEGNYPYWETANSGVWAVPVEFSEPE